MPTLSTVLLSIKGDIKKANIQLNDDSEMTIDSLQKYFKKKEQPENVCYYEYDEKIIYIFGYKKGKKGTENKVELPPPYDNIVLYGDAIVIVSLNRKWESPLPFTVDQWNAFYTGLAGGDYGKNDEGSDEDNSDDDDSDDEDDALSEVDDDKSIKDDYDEEKSVTNDSEVSDEEEEELEQTIVKKKRALVYNNKLDSNTLKEEVSKASGPETSPVRTLCLSTLGFLKDKFSEDDITKLEMSMFECAYDTAIKHYIPRTWKNHQFTEIYRQIVRNVLSNIHPDSPVKNPRLLIRVIEGEFQLSAVPYMSSYEMFPEKWFSLREKQLQREQKILEGNKSRATDQFKCRRCNKRECTYYEMQTRSADEPMTIFITCLNCGKEWRQGG